jgi:hypothetical protein
LSQESCGIKWLDAAVELGLCHLHPEQMVISFSPVPQEVPKAVVDLSTASSHNRSCALLTSTSNTDDMTRHVIPTP